MPPADDDRRSSGGHPILSIEQLGPRVLEVERLAALACRLERDGLADPAEAPRVLERVQSILREIRELVPGFDVSGSKYDPRDLIPPSAAATAAAAGGTPAEDAPDRASEPIDEEEDEDEEQPPEDEVDAPEEEEDGEPEWDLDVGKLGAALQNEALMSLIPEADRDWFRALARRAIESHARVAFADRVACALGELHRTIQECHEEAEKRLASMLAQRHLESRKAGRKPD